MRDRLDKGTQVQVKVGGRLFTGTVHTADRWGDEEGWYIELYEANGTYRYWKQRYDGGKLVSIDGQSYSDTFGQ